MRFTILLLLVFLLPNRPASGQVDLAGEWSPRVYNTHMDIGDYTGIPLNEAGRLRAEAFHPDQLDLPENLCRPHPIDIGLRVSVSQLRITNELDNETRRPVGLRLKVAWQEPEQVIYLDGVRTRRQTHRTNGRDSRPGAGTATRWSTRPRISRRPISHAPAFPRAQRPRSRREFTGTAIC